MIGFVSSFVFGWLVIKVMLDFVQKRWLLAVRLVAYPRRRGSGPQVDPSAGFRAHAVPA